MIRRRSASIQLKETQMKTINMLLAGLLVCGCAKMGGKPEAAADSKANAKAMAPTITDEQADAGEVKLKLDQTPGPVKATIQRELAANGDLEDISKQTHNGSTVYEVNIFARAG